MQEHSHTWQNQLAWWCRAIFQVLARKGGGKGKGRSEVSSKGGSLLDRNLGLQDCMKKSEEYRCQHVEKKK